MKNKYQNNKKNSGKLIKMIKKWKQFWKIENNLEKLIKMNYFFGKTNKN